MIEDGVRDETVGEINTGFKEHLSGAHICNTDGSKPPVEGLCVPKLDSECSRPTAVLEVSEIMQAGHQQEVHRNLSHTRPSLCARHRQKTVSVPLQVENGNVCLSCEAGGGSVVFGIALLPKLHKGNFFWTPTQLDRILCSKYNTLVNVLFSLSWSCHSCSRVRTYHSVRHISLLPHILTVILARVCLSVLILYCARLVHSTKAGHQGQFGRTADHTHLVQVMSPKLNTMDVVNT